MVYGQILSTGLTDVLVVVVRYFGGTKLGTSGLIRAYRTAARDALDHATRVTKLIYITLRLEFGYNKMNEVMRLIKEEGLEMVQQNFSERCLIDIKVRKGRRENLQKKLGIMNEIAVSYID